MRAKFILIVAITLLFSSCSTMRKSIFYGAISGMSLGIGGSAVLSPNKESIAPNMAVWGSLGVLIGAGLGYFFFTDDPENRDLPNMIIPKHKEEQNPISKLENYTITPTD